MAARRGSLYPCKSGWRARVWIDSTHRRTFNLNTTNKAVARAKLQRLLEDPELEAPDVARPETFQEAAERIVKAQGEEGLKTWSERLSRLQRYAYKVIGHLPVTKVRAAHVKEVLHGALDQLSKQSLIHLRNDLGAVLGDLWRDELISENPVQRVRIPKNARVDRRPRQVLTDEEFARFAATERVPEHLYLMALTSRCFGGLRTSDLHAWDWKHFDLDTWQSAEVFRPKTQGLSETSVLERMEIPEVLRGPLRAWWTRQDPARPKRGPVFPIMSGERKGEPQGKRSHARDLRLWLWRAGIHRPLDGFEGALKELRAAEARLAQVKGREEHRAALKAVRLAKERAQALDELQAGSERYQSVDFHSFRRQYATALALLGVNTQTAMSLAGHRNPNTHARYVQLAQVTILTPESALPKLPRPSPMAGPALPLAAGGEEFSHLDAESASDPNEIRTRVTGVRGNPEGDQCDQVHQDSREKLSSTGSPVTTNEAVKGLEGKSRGLKSGGHLLDHELAEILLQTALRGMANKLLLGMRAPNQPN